MNHLMFAYGSNLCLPRLVDRIGAVQSITTGYLTGWSYRWNKIADDGSGKGNIIRTDDSDDRVWGAVFDCPGTSLDALDRIEGVGSGYERRRVTVETGQTPMDAWAYIGTPDSLDDTLKPYDWYQTLVVMGARSMELPLEYIETLAAAQAVTDPDRNRWLAEMTPAAKALAAPAPAVGSKPSNDPGAIPIRAIGTIHTPFRHRDGMPIQPSGARDVTGQIVLRADLEPALKDLDGFSHIELIYYFHKSSGWKPHVVPFLDDVPRGVFSTRAPRRPNPVGHSVVRLDSITGCRLNIRDVDILNGTPLIDIKPHVPKFRNDGPVRCGWLETIADRSRNTRSDHRFTAQDYPAGGSSSHRESKS